MAKWMIQAGWDDAPHLTTQMKEELLNEYPPHERSARSKGIPMLGSGAIYPISEERFLIDDFEIPSWWGRVYGMDVGWNKTAVVWGAVDPQSDVLYLYKEYYVGQAEPASHAVGIKAAGVWIPGVIDPAANGRSQFDGEQLIRSYRELGLKVVPADNAVETGIQQVWVRLTTGRLRVFKSLVHWQDECRGYCRDEKGRVKKEFDHLMDCTRYLVVSGLRRAISVEDYESQFDDQESFLTVQMSGQNRTTGY